MILNAQCGYAGLFCVKKTTLKLQLLKALRIMPIKKKKAKKKATPASFKPGNQARRGRPGLATEDVSARKMSKLELARIIFKFQNWSLEMIEEFIANPAHNINDLIIAKLMYNAFWSGDEGRLNFLLNRSIGPVKEEIEITGNKFAHMTDAELRKERQRLELAQYGQVYSPDLKEEPLDATPTEPNGELPTKET